MSAIKATKSSSRPDLRIRRLAFFSRRNGVPLTASTNKMSFTCRFYQTEGQETAEIGPLSKNKFIAIHDNARKCVQIDGLAIHD